MLTLCDVVLVMDGTRRRGALGLPAREADVAPDGRAEPRLRAPDGGGARRSLPGHLVLPGLVNAHDHLALNVFSPTRPRTRYAHSRAWVDDMRAVIERPAMRALRALPEPARAWHGALKNVLAGTTTVVHHDPWLPVFDAPDFPVTVVPEVGWAHSLDLAGAYGPPIAASHAATPAGRPWFVHLAEGVDRHAAGELDRLAALDALDGRTRLVHGVGLRAADRRCALKAGAGLVWCPVSNAFLLGAVADPADFVRAGRAALGTDARLTAGRDLLEVTRFAVEVAGCRPDDVLAMVTARGAALVGRPNAGRLVPSAPADLVLLRDDGRPPAEQLIDARRADLRLVVARGRPVIGDPDLIDVFKALGEPTCAARLDGRPKCLARWVLAPLRAAGITEPGLELVGVDGGDDADDDGGGDRRLSAVASTIARIATGHAA